MRMQSGRQYLFQCVLLVSFWWWATKTVVAQVRDRREILLAPALEVFTGQGTSEEIYLVTIIVIVFGLICAVLTVNITLLLQKFTFKLLVKVFTIWFVFAAGVSTVSLSYFLSEQPQDAMIRADEEARPQQIRVVVEGSVLTVYWRTVKPTRGQLQFSTNVRLQDQVILSNQAQSSMEHEVRIELEPGETEIWLSIISDGVEYRQQGERLRVRL